MTLNMLLSFSVQMRRAKHSRKHSTAFGLAALSSSLASAGTPAHVAGPKGHSLRQASKTHMHDALDNTSLTSMEV